MNPATPDISIGLTTDQILKAPKNIPAHHASDVELIMATLTNQVASFFFILLIVSGILSFLLHARIDAIIFFSIATINAVIGFFQEFRASKSTQALEQLVKHTVTVRRNGKLETIQSNDIVLGDIVIGEPGDVIVADMVLVQTTDLFLDESVRTGETLPRQAETGETVFSGVSIVQGTMIGQVIAVGSKSSLLMYADKVSKMVKNSSFETFIHKVSKYILIMTVICLALVLIVNVLVQHSLPVSDYVLYAISMLVGVVPESLALIVTLILTREALALAHENVIVKKLSVLQNLGSMNYLFTDKTGTITENNLRIKSLIDHGTLANYLSVIARGMYERTPMDSVFDKAILFYLESNRITEHTAKHELKLSPFQIARGYSIYTLPDGTEIIRGQYAMVSQVCSVHDPEFTNQCLSAESVGLRIIAFGIKHPSESVYTLAGATLFEDPLKSDAIKTYHNMKDLNIDVKIITGDSVAVASYIGGKLDNRIDIRSVYSMDHWKSDGTSNIEHFNVYARCSPDQKSELINEHLDHGVVGFLGEGINDALALKRADIGFVVNNASDVARQSGDVILLEKSLSPIIAAIKMSRKAFAHIRTYLLCTLTGNIGTLVSLTAVVIFWQQIPMLPIQILLNNLLTDIPLMFLIADTISDSMIKRPIRDQASKFFKFIFAFAVLSSIFDLMFFFAFRGYDISILRTGWFVFSVFAELTLVFSLRSELSVFKSPRVAPILGTILIACYAVALALPYVNLGSIFHLYPLSLAQIGILLGITGVYFISNELMKKVLFSEKTV
jgi:Mg2+-importing ATPase